MTDKQIKKLNELTEISQELGLYEDRPDWRITLQADHIKRLEEALKAKEQECERLKKQLEPLQDKYFQGLDTIAVAGLAKLILQKISEVENGHNG